MTTTVEDYERQRTHGRLPPDPSDAAGSAPAPPRLAIWSRMYGAWSLRGWLICRLAGLDPEVDMVADAHDAEPLRSTCAHRAPRLQIDGLEIWDPLAIAEYLHERHPERGLWPCEPTERAWCRSISGEMNSSFANLRAALPMTLRTGPGPVYTPWWGAASDIERIKNIWTECLNHSGGPYLFGSQPTVADAMYATVCIRFRTHDIPLTQQLNRYRDTILNLPALQQWLTQAAAEPDTGNPLDLPDNEF